MKVMLKTLLICAVIFFSAVFSAGFSESSPPALRVGVLEGWSSGALFSALAREEEIDVLSIDSLEADSLDELDVLVFTQQRNPGVLLLHSELITGWVEEGGGVIFLHDAVGYRAHKTIFPSVGSGYNHPKESRVRIAKAHPVTEGFSEGHVFSPGFQHDHVVISPGLSGEVLIDNKNREPVVVAGRYGSGRVVLNGMLTGQRGTPDEGSGTESEPVGDEREILINAIYWLAGMEKASYEAYLLIREPLFEGVPAEDPAWENIPAGGGYFVDVGSGDYASENTFFRAGFTFDAVYFSILCEESEPGKIKARHGDTGRLEDDDSVEVILDPPGDSRYYRFTVNAAGAGRGISYGDRAPLGEDISPDVWEFRAVTGGKNWKAELKIPFEIFETMPHDGDSWGMNIFRNVHSGGEPALHSWSPRVRESVHERENFGKILFVETLPPVEEKQIDEAPEEVFLYARPLSGTFIRDSRGERRISYAQSKLSAPRISPAGDRILYHSRLGGDGSNFGIRVFSKADESSVRICGGEYARWHPSGDKILFQRAGRIVERCLISGEENILSPENLSARYPSYINAGRVVYAAGTENGWGIYRTEVSRGAGGGAVILEAKDGISSPPQVSPDGRKLAYQDGAKIYLLDFAASETRLMTFAPGAQAWPVWSRDGKAISYIQSPEPGRGPFDIYYIEIDNPGEISMLQRDVHPAFDWTGELSRIPPRETLKAGPAVHKAAGSSVILENAWVSVEIDTEANRMFFLYGDENRAEIAFLDGNGEKITEISSAAGSRINVYEAGAELVFESSRGKPAEAFLRLAGHSPYLEVEPVENISAARLEETLEFFIIHDRFASDIVLSPSGGKQHLKLPYAPLIFGVPEGGESLLFLIAPSRKQAVDLADGGERFSGVEVKAAGDSFFLAALSGDGLIHRPPVSAIEDGRGADLDWEQPFHAYWRAIMRGGGGFYSAFLKGEEFDDKGGKIEFPREELPGGVEDALVLIFGRSWHTPPGVITPRDVITDAVGAEKAREVLDIEGARDYRVSGERVPLAYYSDIFIDRVDITGSQSIFNSQGRRGITLNKEGAFETAVNLHNDIVNILEGLDARIMEYSGFIYSLEAEEAFCKDEIRKFREDISAKPVDEVSNFKLAESEIMEMRPGRAISSAGVYKNFLEDSLIAYDQRYAVLSAYRTFVQNIREQAAFSAMEAPGLRENYDLLRLKCREILRNRYYFERDWRGEYSGEEIK